MGRPHRVLYSIVTVTIAVGSFWVGTASPLAAQPGELCFRETGFCITGRIHEFWEQSGGLPVFGFPITAQQAEVVEGRTVHVQWFERNRLELHPENAPPYDVLLGRLGDDLLRRQGRDWRAFPKGRPAADCLFFPEIGHSVCNQEEGVGFRSYWEGHGLRDPALDPFQQSLALFGLPLSEPEIETNAARATVLTQWFERARFEWHPGNAPESRVLLGLLGSEQWDGCFQWNGSGELRDVVKQHRCVMLPAGEVSTRFQVSMPAGHRLIGRGRDRSVVRAAAPWEGNEQPKPQTTEAVVHSWPNTGITLADFTVDAAGLATIGVADRGITLERMRVRGATCDGVSVGGAGMVIRESIIEHNGVDRSGGPANCPHTGVPGSGIYVKKNVTDLAPQADYAPEIVSNIIHDNNGPGIDVDGVRRGILRDNRIERNSAWAAVSLYGASFWRIEGNLISHPKDSDPRWPNHPRCMDGPLSGAHSAGLTLCQDPEGPEHVTAHNEIVKNAISGHYGIRLVGDDDDDGRGDPAWVPTDNRIDGNDVFGSVVGCADDYAPTQPRVGGLNRWTNNNCNGKERWNTLPLYFETPCQSGVRRSIVRQWRVGEVDRARVQEYIGRFDDERTGRAYTSREEIPIGVVVATDFGSTGYTAVRDKLEPLIHQGGWGLFETKGSFKAPNAGACMTIVED